MNHVPVESLVGRQTTYWSTRPTAVSGGKGGCSQKKVDVAEDSSRMNVPPPSPTTAASASLHLVYRHPKVLQINKNKKNVPPRLHLHLVYHPKALELNKRVYSGVIRRIIIASYIQLRL